MRCGVLLVPRPSSLVPLLSAVFFAVACSPEVSRTRDGGPGADPNNKVFVAAPPANPTAADTTLWPDRAPTPVERLTRGEMPPPVGTSPNPAARGAATRPITPDVPATTADQQSFNRGTTANPRRPSSARDSGGRRP